MVNTKELLGINGEDKIYFTEPRYYKNNYSDAGGLSVNYDKAF